MFETGGGEINIVAAKNEITEKFLVSQEVVNLRGKWENKPIRPLAPYTPPPTPPAGSDCGDYMARWKIRGDCLK